MSIYGYCRVSTPKQNIERQVRNITAAWPEAVILREAYSGTRAERPLWSRLIKTVRAGDVIVFDSVSRMSRDAEDGFSVYEDLYRRGVELVFLKEPHISTATFKTALRASVPLTGTDVDYILEGINQYLLALAKEQIRLAFAQAEKEVGDLRQRTREGIQTARLNGKQIGQRQGAKLTTKKSVAAKAVILKYAKAFGGTLEDAAVRKLAGVSRNTYYKYKRELRET